MSTELLRASVCLLLLLFLHQKLAACADGEDSFTYSGFRGANLTLDGVAAISSGGLLVVTDNTIQSKGHAFYRTPLRFKESPNGTVFSFSTTFVFAFISEPADLNGDGMAFLVSPTKDFSRALGNQYLGLFNLSSVGNSTNHVLAIELDTTRNPEFQDIDNNHVGIDINNLKSDESHTAGYYLNDTGSFQNLSLRSGQTMQVWVDYDSHEMLLNVTLAPIAMAKPGRRLLSAVVNLSSVLLETMYVGFSASNGPFLTSHYVLGWSFKMNGVAQALDSSLLPSVPRAKSNHKLKVLRIGLPLASSTLVLVIVGTVVFILRRRGRYSELLEDWELEYGPHRFSYKDLFRAAKGFRDTELLGMGAFGRVYKGVLPSSGSEVAIKRVSHGSRQGMREFIAEIVSLGRLRHRNLVQLLGYCRRQGELLLVYDYMPNGSLEKFLHDQAKPALDWATRFRIIKGVASGLLYLHEDWEQVVVHRDIKASNVLLDNELNGRLGDFGLARLYDHGTDPQTTHVVGTMGYLAPELARTGKATTITDVFAFGAFLLEVACGRRPVDPTAHEDQLVLQDWVVEKWRKGSILETRDPTLGEEYAVEEVELVLKLGLLCSHPLPTKRPSMRQVVRYLEGHAPLPELSPANLSFSLLALLRKEGFDDQIMSFYCLLAASGSANHEFIFNGFSGANLTLDGVASITSSGLLRITNATTQVKGHAFRPSPLRFRDQTTGKIFSFSTTFVFGFIPEFANLSGHGVVFLISPTKDFSGALGSQFLGVFNQSNNGNSSDHILGIELDTIYDPEFQDIDDNHVGIDINSLTSNSSHTAGYYADDSGLFKALSLRNGEALQVWIDYDGQEMLLNVTLASIQMAKPQKPLLSAIIDLSSVLTGPMYVGFSSSTGSLLTSHYILGWSFNLNGVAQVLNYSLLPSLPRVRPKRGSKALTISLPLASAGLVLIVAGVVAFIVRWRIKYAEVREDWELQYGPHRYSYKDLYEATKGFEDEDLLGIGGFGKVYKGVLQTSKSEIAVKRVSHESRQGMREFVAEIVSIGRLRHRNLVQLLGYCRRKGELLLVYEYMPNGSLDKFLYGQDKPTLDWATRFRIIKGVASGLLYLHEDWEQVVIHRDIKASNVLLDHELNGRLGDFGLARLYDHGTVPLTTRVVGTMGYLAPELVRTGKAATITDVFAFGIFLLEVACGRRPVDPTADEEKLILSDWVLKNWQKGSILETTDPRLGEAYAVEEVELVLKLGLLCSHPLPTERPSMRQVVRYLEGHAPLPELSPTYLSFGAFVQRRNDGVDGRIMSNTSPVATTSVLSGGR
ncbi:L-type lectin-domain containing receptor kinase SIT2-like isoform X1 [Musa acuminata AAA Group]|uniref:L-type lectin-domain containing receptor kinase SIT2-like isoform X1 n=1 Tax=Musa acuminata AAA Group TaxID=214697 RepID=UPI0031E0B604